MLSCAVSSNEVELAAVELLEERGHAIGVHRHAAARRANVSDALEVTVRAAAHPARQAFPTFREQGYRVVRIDPFDGNKLIPTKARWFEPKCNKCVARVAAPAFAEADQAIDRFEMHAIAVGRI